MISRKFMITLPPTLPNSTQSTKNTAKPHAHEVQEGRYLKKNRFSSPQLCFILCKLIKEKIRQAV